MHELALSNNVPLEPLTSLGQKGYEYHIPADLENWMQQVRQEGFQSQAYFYLQQFYIHHSVQYGSGPEDSPYFINSNKQSENPDTATENGTREVFYNNIDEAISPPDNNEYGNYLTEVNNQTSTIKGRY